MATIIEEHKLIYVNVSGNKNNNKFWIGKLYDNGDVSAHYGRMGEDGKKLLHPGRGSKYFNTKLKEKKRKGYKPAKVLNGAIKATAVGGSKLKRLAKTQIKHSNPTTAKLIDYFTDVNRHQISAASGGKIIVDKADNLIKTPMGVVNQEAIDGARKLLLTLGDCVKSGNYAAKFQSAVAEYCMLIPQATGRKKGWDRRLFPDLIEVQKQNSLLNSLQVTLTHVIQSPATDNGKDEEVFRCDMTLSEDGKLMDRINKLYKLTRRSMHACHGMKVNRVFLVDIKTMRESYEKHGAKLSNVWELWHGTQSSNVLSILKGGLVIPPSSASHVTGRMYGDGLYFSDQSTKSLNYAQGYWHGSNANKCYMFLSDVAMGNFYTPKSYSSFRKLPKGSDSTFAKANVSGVSNNEMIVYRTSQANLKLLIEFIK